MPRNAESSPTPVYGTAEAEWEYFYKLPREVRLVLVEARYEYNAKMVYDMLQMLRVQHFMSMNQASIEIVQQIGLNDYHTVKQEMEKKWMEIGLPMPPLTLKSNYAQRSPTRRTASTASRSGIHRFVRGLKPPKTSAIPQGMVFDLSGTALLPLSKATRTGSSSRKPKGGTTVR